MTTFLTLVILIVLVVTFILLTLVVSSPSILKVICSFIPAEKINSRTLLLEEMKGYEIKLIS